MDGRNSPLRLHALPLHQNIAVSSSSTEPVLFRILAPRVEQAPGTLPRLTAVLLLDVSGSMQGTPIAQVKDSVARLSAILSDEDGLGVVTFSTSAQTISPIRALKGPAARRAVEQATEALAADKYTNISSGLAHAALLFEKRAPDERQMILLLSDGQPNVGTQTVAGLSQEVERIKSRGIAVSTLGFGADHNEDLLLALSDAGGGRYAFVKDPLMAGLSFARALGAQRDVVAEDVNLVLSPGPGVEIMRIIGEARTSFGEGGLRVRLSDLLLGEEINVVAELKVSGRNEAGRFRLLRATLEGNDASKNRAPFSLREDVSIGLLAGPKEGPWPVDPAVAEVVVMARAAELRQRARGLCDQRNFAAAADCLQQALNAILAVHGGVPPEKSALRDVYETLLDDLQVAKRAPAPESYSIMRKAQLDQNSFITGINRAGNGVTPSAEHMVIKLRNTHGVAARARLVCIEGQDRGLAKDLQSECRIGRSADNDVVLADGGATRHHVLIQWVGRSFVAHDLGSSNGTFINGKHVVDDYVLRHGDIISVGQTRLRFESLDKKDL